MNEINPSEDYAHTLKLLVAMGFNDMEKNRNAVRRANGLLQSSIELLSEEKEENKPAVRSNLPIYTFPKLDSRQAALVLQCAAMGFEDEGKIRHALTLSKWEVEAAIDRLVDDNGKLDRYLQLIHSGFSSVEKASIPPPQRSSSLSKFTNFATDWQSANTQITNANCVLKSPSNSPYSMYTGTNNFGSSFDPSNQKQQFTALNSNSTVTDYDILRNPQAAIPVFDHPITTVGENPFEEVQKPKYNASEFDPFGDSNAL